MLKRSAAPFPSGSVSNVVSEGIYRSTFIVKVSSPGTVSLGRSIVPGQGALTSPQEPVPAGSPILIEPTLPRPESAGSGTTVNLPALFPVPRPLVVSKSSSRMIMF